MVAVPKMGASSYSEFTENISSIFKSDVPYKGYGMVHGLMAVNLLAIAAVVVLMSVVDAFKPTEDEIYTPGGLSGAPTKAGGLVVWIIMGVLFALATWQGRAISGPNAIVFEILMLCVMVLTIWHAALTGSKAKSDAAETGIWVHVVICMLSLGMFGMLAHTNVLFGVTFAPVVVWLAYSLMLTVIKYNKAVSSKK